jgi:hypothetical protein
VLPHGVGLRLQRGRLLRAAGEHSQHQIVVLGLIVHPQQRAPPPFELKRSHRQHGMWVEGDDLVVIGLLASGAGKILALELDAHVVAVMPTSATAARRLLAARLAIQGHGVAGMLRHREGAAAGDERHEKRGADVLRRQLAAADVVVAVPAHSGVMRPLARSHTRRRTSGIA